MRALLSLCLVSLLSFTGASVLRGGDGPKNSPGSERLGKAQVLVPHIKASVAFAPDGKRVAWVTTTPGLKKQSTTVTIHVWDTATAKEICRGEFTADSAWATTPITFSSDGKQVLVGTYHEVGGPAKITRYGLAQIRLFNAITGKEMPRFSSKKISDTGEFNALAVAADGKTVITSCGDAVQVWKLASGQMLRAMPLGADGEGGVLFSALSPDGQFYAESLSNGPVHLWDVAKGQKLGFAITGTPLAFSTDGKILATAGPNQIRLWGTTTGKELGQVKGTAVETALSADGKLLAWTAKDKTVHVAEVEGGKELGTLPAVGGPLAFSPDGRTVALVSSDGTVVLWTVPGKNK